MTEDECLSKVRYALNDRTGVLRFESFDIVNAPQCARITERLREYLVGRALAEVDVERIRAIGRMGHPLCARVVAELLAELRRFLSGSGTRPTKPGMPGR